MMMDLSTSGHYQLIYKLNDDQTISLVDKSATVIKSSTLPVYTVNSIFAAGVVNGHVYAAYTAGAALSTGKFSVYAHLGTLGVALTGTGAAAEWENTYIHDKTSVLGDYFFNALTTGSDRSIYQCPVVFVDDGASGLRMLTYVGKPEVTGNAGSVGSAHNTLIATLGATYPNGFTVDEAGTVVFGSFDDIGLYADGSAGAASCPTTPLRSTSSPTAPSISRGVRIYNETVDTEPNGCYCKVRIYSWDGTTQTAVSTFSGSLFNDLTNLGIENVPPMKPRGVQIYFGDSGSIYATSFYQGSGLIPQRYINSTVGSFTFATNDVAPAYIIYRIITDTDWGFSRDPATIDQAATPTRCRLVSTWAAWSRSRSPRRTTSSQSLTSF
jgi:hypothetical protein